MQAQQFMCCNNSICPGTATETRLDGNASANLSISFIILGTFLSTLILLFYLYLSYQYTPRYEVYKGYIVFALFVTMFVCLSVCLLFVNFFSVKDFSATT